MSKKPSSSTRKAPIAAQADTHDGHFIGHDAIEAGFLDAYRSGRMPHAWILAGLEGIGKAGFALRAARFLLANPDASSAAVRHAHSLDVSPDNPAARRVAARAHTDLFFLESESDGEKKTKSGAIPVEDVRKMLGFFSSTAGEGGWKIAIIDSLDDLKSSAANALLKMLEEPPPRSLFLMVSHNPGRLLPTIRSRCHMVRFKPLSESEIVTALSPYSSVTDQKLLSDAARRGGGSVKRAMTYLDAERMAMVHDIETTLARLPDLDRKHLLAMADHFAKKDGAESFALFIETVDEWIASTCRADAQSGHHALRALAELWEKFTVNARMTDIYNLDRRPFFITMMNDLADAMKA